MEVETTQQFRRESRRRSSKMMESELGSGLRRHPEDDGAAKVVPSASSNPQTCQPEATPYMPAINLNQPVPESTAAAGGVQLHVGKFLNLAERKVVHSRRGINSASKPQRQPVTFLNEDPSQWIVHGVDILPTPEPDVVQHLNCPVKKPIQGKVLHGTKEAIMNLLAEDDDYFEEDTGIILSPEKMTTSRKHDYKYEKFVSYDKSFSLGHGAFGKATLIVDKTTHASIVKKKIKMSEFRPEEVLVPSTLEHSCLVQIYGCIVQQDKYVEIFMSFAGFSFNKVVGDEKMRMLLTEPCILDIGYQGYSALDYLQQKDVRHLDIKPQNLCLYWNNVRASYDLKICDFGACMLRENPIRSKGWTPAYMAPEQCRYVLVKAGFKGQWSKEEMEISGQADLYSFGSSLLYLCYWLHCIPKLFPSHNDLQIIMEVAKNPTGLQTFVQDSWDPKLKEVLWKSFCASPRDRLRPRQALHILSGCEPLSAPIAKQTDQLVRKRKNSSVSVEDMEVDSPPPPKKIPILVEEMEEDLEPPEIIIIEDAEPSEILPFGSSPAGNLPDLDTLFSWKPT